MTSPCYGTGFSNVYGKALIVKYKQVIPNFNHDAGNRCLGPTNLQEEAHTKTVEGSISSNVKRILKMKQDTPKIITKLYMHACMLRVHRLNSQQVFMEKKNED